MDRPVMEAQKLSVKRAQVEFHNFASLGEPERAERRYRLENRDRGAIINRHAAFIGRMLPFLEVGANAGHTSYLLANDFGAGGFALDISADALRHGMALQEQWGMQQAPVRIAGDALNLPFQDGSLQFVMTFQTLSQFMDLDAVFAEVKRVLAPGGVFLFAEEPVRRLLSVRLYRCPYYETMKPWERKLFDWGLLGYLVQDVIGANQEESFGIRQNHRMYLQDWKALIERHFVAHEIELHVPERGWGERIVKRAAVQLDPYKSVWRAARLLGGTLAAVCRKSGAAVEIPGHMDRFEAFLRCPDCRGNLHRDDAETLRCGSCSYSASYDGGVYNLIRTVERTELYPGDREDMIDFSLPSHTARLLEGWYDLEGVYGNKYRWISGHAAAQLKRVTQTPQRLRIRGHAQEQLFQQGKPVVIDIKANGTRAGRWELDRTGLFLLEADLPDAPEYRIEVDCSPHWKAPGDERELTVNLSMIRLTPRD
ncbi:MAG TPA: class I SAM-dependent methyltransferase [Bryobacteraceae bacterium]|nr:class I SAM-dependent methyltransferase [Bryobacteraceae bacterium]